MNRIILSLIAVIIIIAPQQASARDKFLDIKEVTSPGGINAWLVEDHSLPVISIKFAFKGAGAKLDPIEKQGLTRLASNTMDEGAGPYDSQLFQKTLNDKSITLHFDTSRDHFYGTVKTLTRHRNKAYELLRLALGEARFDEEPVARMREANMTRIKSSLSQPNWIAARIMNDVAFAGHPYAMNSGGTLSSLKNVSRDDLAEFAKARLGKDNLYVAVVGDITEQELVQMLDQVFSEALPEVATLNAIKNHKIQNAGTIALYKHDIPQTIISILQPGINHDDPDYQAARIMNFTLGGSGFGSRLTEEVREKRGLTYSIYTNLMMMDHINGLGMTSSTKNESAAEVLGLIKQEWQKMREHPITHPELNAAKSYLIGSVPLRLSSTDAIANLLLSLQLKDHPADYLDQQVDKINAVTTTDILRVSKELLTPDLLTVVLVGQPTKIKTTKTIETLPNVE